MNWKPVTHRDHEPAPEALPFVPDEALAARVRGAIRRHVKDVNERDFLRFLSQQGADLELKS